MAKADVGRRFEKDVGGLVGLLKESGVDIRPETAESLTALSAVIHRWNKVVNLVSRKDIDRLVSYHFCDSASVLPIIRPATDIHLLDIGGSNGLPGLVLSAISPHVKVTVCDSKRKREAFLEEACHRIGTGVDFEIDRVDSEVFRDRHLETFDLIAARAVTKLRHLFKWCMPLLRPGGYLVAYKGSRCLEEARQAETDLFRHGGTLLAIVGSPWASLCNPYRIFAIAGKAAC
jgi:16S rRNA (guanine527-N7)-methyltransferase